MSEKPRILSLFGGVVLLGQERGNLEALLALKEQGCEVLCLIRNEEWITRIPDALDSHDIAWKKIPFLSTWRHGSSLFELARNGAAFVRANVMFLHMVRQFRPTHIHAFNQINVLTFILGLMLVGTPLIYRAGDKPTLHHWAWRAIWRFIRFRTARFVAVSRFIAGCLTETGVARDRIDVIYNRPPSRHVAVSSRPELPGNCDRWMIYVGQLIPEKGVDLAVEAFRKLALDRPGLGFLIVGRISDWDGDQWARDLRKAISNDPSIRERVVFTGELEDVESALHCARVHVAPSLCQEALGNVVIEAKKAGIPSIVFPSGGLPELIEQGVDGEVCEASTAEALALHTARYVDDEAVARRAGVAARTSLGRLGNGLFAQNWLAAVMRAGKQGSS